jgi:endonuclease YncB( thermonuclease family)
MLCLLAEDMRKTVAGVVVALLCVAFAVGDAACFEARIKSVRDGDSLSVYGQEDVVINVRLYGIDAPEAKQPHGYEARKALAKLVGRKSVCVEPQDTDRYGRTVAIVRLADGVSVNEALVAQGSAWLYPEYCRREDLCPRLRELEEQARAERRGLWKDDDPVRPSVWRKEHKTEEWYKGPERVIKSFARSVKSVLLR